MARRFPAARNVTGAEVASCMQNTSHCSANEGDGPLWTNVQAVASVAGVIAGLFLGKKIIELNMV